MTTLQGLPGCLPWGMLLVFFNDFLAQQKGFSVPAATLVHTCRMCSRLGICCRLCINTLGLCVLQFPYNTPQALLR